MQLYSGQLFCWCLARACRILSAHRSDSYPHHSVRLFDLDFERMVIKVLSVLELFPSYQQLVGRMMSIEEVGCVLVLEDILDDLGVLLSEA